MSLAQIATIVTIVSLLVPLLVAVGRYSRALLPGNANTTKAQTIQNMSFELADQLRSDLAVASTKIAELTAELDSLILRARLAEAEREDAYEALRDNNIPLPHPRPRGIDPTP